MLKRSVMLMVRHLNGLDASAVELGLVQPSIPRGQALHGAGAAGKNEGQGRRHSGPDIGI